MGDRFVRDGEAWAIDVGTGRRVWLEERRAEDGVSMRRWEESSANLMSRWHSHLAPIVDAFALAEDRFLVAHPYAPERPAARARREVRAVAEGVAAFLRAQGLRAGEAIEARARVIDGVVKIQPGGDMGEEADADARAVVAVAGRVSDARGVRIKRRPVKRKGAGIRAVGVRLARIEAVEAAVAAIECLRGGEVASLFVGAARGAGFSTFLGQMTREVRRLGIVPVHVLAWRRQRELMSLLAGRTVALVAEGEDEVEGRELRCAIGAWGASRSRLAAVIARVEPGHVCEALSLPPMAIDDLVSRLWVSGAVAVEKPRRSLVAIVRRAEGLPGRAIARLLPEHHVAARAAPDVLLAAEAAAGAADEELAGGEEVAARVSGAEASWAAEAQIAPFVRTHRSLRARGVGGTAVTGMVRAGPPVSARVRGRGEAWGDPLSTRFGMGPQAEALWRRRRWASSARSLHRDVAAFARRGDHLSAAKSALALGRVRLSMADAVSALRWFRASVAHALEAGDDRLAAQALAWQGIARVDEAEVEEGEVVLRCAWMVARHGGAGALAEWVRVGLARCLYWQGRFSDMPSGEVGVDEDVLVVRVAMVRGQLGQAATRLSEAARRVERVQDADVASALDGEAARLHLLIGDLDACDRYLKDAMARRCSRACMLRLYLILHLRLLREQTAAARRRRERLAHTLLRSDTPRLLRIRARYWIERPSGRWSRELRAFVARFGEAALAGGALSAGGDPMWDDLQALLRIGHEGTDEREALARICGHVRERIGAARVAVHVSVEGAGLANALPLVHSGSTRLASGALAHRLLDTGVLAPVAAGTDGLEAGVPVKYGATVLGAIVARWTIGARPDERLVTMVLMTMGAVAAPMLQAFRDRHAGGAARETSDAITSPAGPALLGRSAAIEALRQTIRRVASAPFHVLVHGESGSGKELVARALHHHSPRRHRKFCAINCAALTDELFEAEMFGHTRGAFTGALVERQGLFEEADGGTLFLDEVGELSARGQAKLLRVMQDGEVRRVGENLSRRVEARIVAATNRVLKEDVRRGQFRADLLYRLDVIHLDVPPLRDRREDIPLLARAFWDEAARKVGSRATMAAETVAVLARYDWPGNVRELQNALMALAAQAGPRGRVMPEALVPLLGELAERSGRATVSFVKARRAFEARLVRAALVRSGGASARAARDLGLTRQGLAKVMARLGIVATDAEGGSGGG